MLNTLRGAIHNQPLLASLPGVFIFAVSPSLNLLSDRVRQAMEMR